MEPDGWADGGAARRLPPPPPSASLTVASRPVRCTPAAFTRPAPFKGPSAPTAARLAPEPVWNAPLGVSSDRGQAAQRPSSPDGRGPLRWTTPLGAGLALLRLLGTGAARVGAHFAPGNAGAPEAGCLSDHRVFPSLLPRGAAGAPCGKPAAPGARGPALLWFRNDLRLSDNEALAAANAATSLVPVYIFDDREFGKSPAGFDLTGPNRAAFILGALHELRRALRDRGSELVVRCGRPEELLAKLAAATGATRVFCHGEVTAEERRVEAGVAAALDAQGASLQVTWGSTLFHPEDLPFRPSAAPLHYGDFRDRVSGRGRGRGAPVRHPLPVPESLKGLPAGSAIDAGEIPTLAGLGFSAAALRRTSTDATLALLGGERAAMDHVQAFIGLLASGKGARTPSSIRVGPAFSARVSPYLAIGCLSPRTVWHELSRGQGGAAGARPSPPPAAAGAGATGVGVPQRDGASWLLFELTGLLMWRDFFRFVSARLSTAATAATPARAAAAFAF